MNNPRGGAYALSSDHNLNTTCHAFNFNPTYQSSLAGFRGVAARKFDGYDLPGIRGIRGASMTNSNPDIFFKVAHADRTLPTTQLGRFGFRGVLRSAND